MLYAWSMIRKPPMLALSFREYTSVYQKHHLSRREQHKHRICATRYSESLAWSLNYRETEAKPIASVLRAASSWTLHHRRLNAAWSYSGSIAPAWSTYSRPSLLMSSWFQRPILDWYYAWSHWKILRCITRSARFLRLYLSHWKLRPLSECCAA